MLYAPPSLRRIVDAWRCVSIPNMHDREEHRMSEKSDPSPGNLPPDGYPAPREGMLLTHLLIVRDVDRSRAFYRDVLGAEVVQEQ